MLVAVIFELCVDRSVGQTINKQWVQQPESILITGMFTHVLPVSKLYQKGFIGWYRVHSLAFRQMKLAASIVKLHNKDDH